MGGGGNQGGFQAGPNPGSWGQYRQRVGSQSNVQLQQDGSQNGGIPGKKPRSLTNFGSADFKQAAQFGDLENALQYDRSKQQYEADAQRSKIGDINDRFGEQLGYAAERIRNTGQGQADHLRSIADQERELFEQKSASILKGFKDMTAQKAASDNMAAGRNLQSTIADINDNPNLTDSQKLQMRQEAALQTSDQRSQTLAQVGAQYNEAAAQLATGHLEQSLNSAQMREALHAQASAILIGAEDAALDYEVGGMVTLANMIRANPYQHFSVASGFAQMLAATTAGDGGGGFALNGSPSAAGAKSNLTGGAFAKGHFPRDIAKDDGSFAKKRREAAAAERAETEQRTAGHRENRRIENEQRTWERNNRNSMRNVPSSG